MKTFRTLIIQESNLVYLEGWQTIVYKKCHWMFRVKYRDSIGNWHNKAMIIIVDSKFIEKEKNIILIVFRQGCPHTKKDNSKPICIWFLHHRENGPNGRYTMDRKNHLNDIFWKSVLENGRRGKNHVSLLNVTFYLKKSSFISLVCIKIAFYMLRFASHCSPWRLYSWSSFCWVRKESIMCEDEKDIWSREIKH